MPTLQDRFYQPAFDELPSSRPLADVTFVVVDLETTGGVPAQCQITEIGAVKVQGGQVLGEFATLVNPGCPIPPFITALTGITEAMVAPAPRINSVLPSFLEFARGSVLVAHNASFDVGFLTFASSELGIAWPGFPVVDTVTLARRVLERDEVANCKLGTLAKLFRTETAPSHRALDDARATVDVLHGLIARLGTQGVHSLEELQAYTRLVSRAQRSKRHLAHDLPHAPGVYIFRAADDRPLYVGTSRDLRSRVQQYFLASETRSRMGEMIAAAERVEAVTCAHALEAQIRELRLIATHKPPYNRRSRYPERGWWLSVTCEPYPRLSLVRQPPADRTRGLGPFRSKRAAQQACEALHEALPIRQCTGRLSVRRPSAACVLAELGRCGAPCEHRESVAEYQRHVDVVLGSFTNDPSGVVEPVLRRIEQLACALRYEQAAELRDLLAQLVRVLIRMQATQALAGVSQLMAAAPAKQGWELALIRYGKLAAAANSATVHQVLPTFEMLTATAETVGPEQSAYRSNETAHLLRWLQQPHIRLVHIDGIWSCPVRGAGRWEQLLAKLCVPPN